MSISANPENDYSVKASNDWAEGTLFTPMRNPNRSLKVGDLSFCIEKKRPFRWWHKLFWKWAFDIEAKNELP